MKEEALDAARRLGHGALDFAENRLRLLQSEIADEVDRLGALLTHLILLALTALLTFQFFALLVLAAAWDTRWRLMAMMALTMLAACATGLAYYTYQARKRRDVSQAESIFAASLNELTKDRQTLEKMQ